MNKKFHVLRTLLLLCITFPIYIRITSAMAIMSIHALSPIRWKIS